MLDFSIIVYYNEYAMKKENLPAFAQPYKTRGYDVRLVGSSYQLFRITSKRVPDKSYPVLVQTYLGTIDPQKGLIPKKDDSIEPVEFGLSDFIIRHFKRTLMRSVFNGTAAQVYLGIVYFLYGNVQERFVEMTYVRRYLEQVPQISGPNALKRIKKISELINKHLCDLIPNEDDRLYLIAKLRDIKVNPNEINPSPKCPDSLRDLIGKYTQKDIL